MDLHDFEDVAQNYDLYLGQMFKNEDNHEGFLEFYLEFLCNNCKEWLYASSNTGPAENGTFKHTR